MSAGRTRYRSIDDDSALWDGFAFRPGDIVISTRSKSGTTWMQMICALLVFQTSELPAPLHELSPWLDWLVTPHDEVLARLDAQRHRRFIKTHTPLDGLPLDRRATFVVVARHPLDTAVSMYHHGGNIDRPAWRKMIGVSEPDQPAPPRPPLDEWLVHWIEGRAVPTEDLDSLAGVMWHAADAWSRRHEGNVLLFHYADLSADLEAEMRRLAGRLGIEVPEQTWPMLVAAASFENMRSHADDLAPAPPGILKDRVAFFRDGSSGGSAAVLGKDALARYQAKVETLASPAVLAWLHGGTGGRPTAASAPPAAQNHRAHR